MLLDRQPMKVLKEDAVRCTLTLKLFLLVRCYRNICIMLHTPLFYMAQEAVSNISCLET